MRKQGKKISFMLLLIIAVPLVVLHNFTQTINEKPLAEGKGEELSNNGLMEWPAEAAVDDLSGYEDLSTDAGSRVGGELFAESPGADAAGTSALQWWFVPSTYKVFRHCDFQPVQEGAFQAARGEYESIQLVLRSSTVQTAVPLKYRPAGDNPLPENWVELFEVFYVSTPGVAKWGFPESNPERRRLEYPDPLVPARASITLPAGENQPIWIRIKVPSDAQPGHYHGLISAGSIIAPLRVTVWPFELPQAGSLQTSFGLGGKGLAEQHQVEIGTPEYQELYRRYYDALLDYRISAYYIPYSGPGTGDNIMDPQARPYLLDERVTSFILTYTADRSRLGSAWHYIGELGAAEKAWLYNLDEPQNIVEYKVIKDQVSEYVSKVVPGLRYGIPFYTGPRWDHSLTPFDELGEYVDLWILQTDYYYHGHGAGSVIREQALEQHRRGDDVWLYVSLAPREPFCNFLVNNSALQHRLLFWQIYAEEFISGLLYWQTTYWQETANPFVDIATVKKHDPGLWGDGSLFYPGNVVGLNGPVGSIRLEMIRDGLEDFEYFILAEELLGKSAVRELVKTVAPSLVSYTQDPAVFLAHRKQLGESIARMVSW